MILTVLLISWLMAVSIQLIYILFIFTRTAWHSSKLASNVPAKNLPAVSVIVVAHNELANLKELLPLLNQQDYPHFEVLVMDDRSHDGTHEYLLEELGAYEYVRFIHIRETPDHVTPKKYALTIALKKAQYPVVLLTDADCRPAGSDWLVSMVGQMQAAGKDIVLGFSPYMRKGGLLNFLIRSETLFTAVQYLSLAIVGKPYMGVGRNLMYRKQVFFENRGFYTHLDILGGDDDLFMNEVATGHNTTVSLDPATFVWSIPKTTWAAWRRQKRRHLNVGRYYKPGAKLRLGLLVGSHVVSWLLALVAGLWAGWYALTGQVAELMQPLLLASTGVFVFRLLVFWLVIGKISHRLAHTVHWMLMPIMDVTLAIYYSFMSVVVLFTKRRKIIW